MSRFLSKSRVLSGLQCPKRLYLEVNQPALALVAAQTASAFQGGHQVGALARSLWPGGHLIAHDEDLNAALAETERWLAAAPERPLFEATFRHDGVLVRADVLAGAELIEVKAATRVKDYHLKDCAIQTWVIGGTWRLPRSVRLAHVDCDFVYPGDGDYEGLLKLVDVTAPVYDLVPSVPEWVALCRDALEGPCPEREIGEHCHSLFDCPFIGHCAPPQPEYPVSILPRGGAVAAELLAEGIADVRDIPPGRLVKPDHERVRTATVQGTADLRPDLPALLAALPYPRFYLDFEALQFAVPIWAGTRPYQQLPFQWSCHIEHSADLLDHLQFLDTTGENPLRPFAESLLELLEGGGPILVYSAFEKTILKGLRAFLPDLAAALQAVIERLVDLLPPVRAGFYHPAQKGSWSIKAALPAIAPDLSYADLGEVQDGIAAQSAYLEMIDPATPIHRKQALQRQLLDYCGRDSFALVRLVDHFLGRPPHPLEDDRFAYPPSTFI